LALHPYHSKAALNKSIDSHNGRLWNVRDREGMPKLTRAGGRQSTARLLNRNSES
jgi:hypothetical protein